MLDRSSLAGSTKLSKENLISILVQKCAEAHHIHFYIIQLKGIAQQGILKS